MLYQAAIIIIIFGRLTLSETVSVMYWSLFNLVKLLATSLYAAWVGKCGSSAKFTNFITW